LALDHPNQMPETVRAFVAVSVDDAVENAVAALVDELRAGRNDGGIRWVRRGNLHLTLKFLGPAVPAGKLEPLKPMLERIAAETAPFELSVRGVGGFPSLERPRVIWVGLEGEGLGQLARRVEEAAVRCGFEAEKRAFTGHLTIGRVGSYRGFDTIRRALQAARERDFGRSRIDALTLYRSTLGPEGSVYDPLARYELRGGAG
jgi:2'-5' RNA ligase